VSEEAVWSEPDDARLDQMIEEQEVIFLKRQPESARLLERARESLAGGVTSSWQIARPQAVWISHGAGSKVYDADGNEYVDLHGGYGVMAVGHSHPRIVQAVSRRISRGSHFAQPTEDSIAVAEELAARFGLPLWRFSNSGTEATMDAVHLMRAATGRDKIVKVEGTYHGHHDSLMVSVANDASEIGDDPDYPLSAPAGTGIPGVMTDLVVVIEYNDIESLKRAFARHDGEIAGVIMEPIMMNSGIIPPEEGYLEQVKAVTHENGALLAFDEVKTGLTVSAGGATAYLGVSPDIICLAKALGGGLPCGALGGTAEVMNLIVEGEYEQVGTFNGNPLTMAAALATLTEVLTDEAYETVSSLRKQMVQGCEEVIRQFDFPAHVVAIGAKGCITFTAEPVHNYREFLQIDDRYSHLHWLFQHNGGVFLPPWGKAEQWLLSPQHTAEDAQRFIDNFRTYAGALRG